jgi:hypothetical protein
MKNEKFLSAFELKKESEKGSKILSEKQSRVNRNIIKQIIRQQRREKRKINNFINLGKLNFIHKKA